eukprot:525291_1
MALSDIIYFLLAVICTILIIMMLVGLIRHEYKYKQYGWRFWKASIDVSLSIFIFTMYAIFTIHSTADRLYAIIVSITNSPFNTLLCISGFMELVTFSMPKILLYIFFVVRLHSVFKSSSFAVSK